MTNSAWKRALGVYAAEQRKRDKLRRKARELRNELNQIKDTVAQGTCTVPVDCRLEMRKEFLTAIEEIKRLGGTYTI